MIVFTDGAALNNGKKNCVAACGVVWVNGEFPPEGFKLARDELHTNNRAEYMAAIRALEQADELDPERKETLQIYTDSKLMVETVTKWADNWESNGWKKANGSPVKNLDLVKKLQFHNKQRSVEWIHTRAHTNQDTFESRWNDVADKLAGDAARKK